MSYIRKGIYPIETILSNRLSPKLKKTKETIRIIDGDKSYMSSERYEVFDRKGTSCVTCGIEGKYFAKEKSKYTNTDMWHFNLYALNNDGIEIMMTKDHIIPKSLGGKNDISNYQTMCRNCNQAKGNSLKLNAVQNKEGVIN